MVIKMMESISQKVPKLKVISYMVIFYTSILYDGSIEKKAYVYDVRTYEYLKKIAIKLMFKSLLLCVSVYENTFVNIFSRKIFVSFLFGKISLNRRVPHTSKNICIDFFPMILMENGCKGNHSRKKINYFRKKLHLGT